MPPETTILKDNRYLLRHSLLFIHLRYRLLSELNRLVCRRVTSVFARQMILIRLFLRYKAAVGQRRIRLYEVKMKSFHRAPMAIVHAILRRLEQSKDISALLSEYWSPKRTWHYFECIGPEMEIIGSITVPCIDIIVMTLNYQADARAASCL